MVMCFYVDFSPKRRLSLSIVRVTLANRMSKIVHESFPEQVRTWKSWLMQQLCLRVFKVLIHTYITIILDNFWLSNKLLSKYLDIALCSEKRKNFFKNQPAECDHWGQPGLQDTTRAICNNLSQPMAKCLQNPRRVLRNTRYILLR